MKRVHKKIRLLLLAAIAPFSVLDRAEAQRVWVAPMAPPAVRPSPGGYRPRAPQSTAPPSFRPQQNGWGQRSQGWPQNNMPQYPTGPAGPGMYPPQRRLLAPASPAMPAVFSARRQPSQGLEGGSTQPRYDSQIVPSNFIATNPSYKLGITTIATSLWLPGANGQWTSGVGLHVASVTPGAAAYGRLDPGDIIVAVDGVRVWDAGYLPQLLQNSGRNRGTATLTLRNIRTGRIENHVVPLWYY